MLKTSWRNLWAHKLRMSLSGMAIMLGVAFVAGTMIFTDTLEETFTSLFESTAADVNISPESAYETGMAGTSLASNEALVPASVVSRVADVDGVAAVEGNVQAEGVYILDSDGEVLDTGGAPGLGMSWGTEEALASSTLVEGEAPSGPGEVALDETSARDAGLEVGDPVTLLTNGPRIEAEVVGIFEFGSSGGLAGASLTAFDTATAQELLLEPGHFSAVSVAAEDGVDDATLRQRVAEALGGEYAVKTRAQQAEDSAASIEEGLGFISTFLLVFAGVALFVGSFIILNTFSMLVAQRTRELALLRSLGASRRQVTGSVLTEAAVLGVIGATMGLGLGIGLAQGLKALFGQLGVEMTGTLVIGPSTVVWAYVVGIVLTLVAAYLPARRASRVAPVTAMRGETTQTAGSLRRRTLAGGGLLAVAVAGLSAGFVAEDPDLRWTAVGALAAITSAIVLSPVLTSPFMRVVGSLLQRFTGMTGHLARENSLRNPRRTAATSSALMIGLALVAGFSVLGASANASVDAIIDDTMKADYVLTGGAGQPFTPEVAKGAAALPGVASATSLRLGSAQFDGEEQIYSAFDADSLTKAMAFDVTDGDPDGLATAHGLMVDASTAAAQGWGVGDRVELRSATGSRLDLTVTGVFADNDALGSLLVSTQTYDEAGGAALDRYVYVVLAAGADAAAVQAGLEELTARFPIVELEDAEGFKEDQRAQVDQLLALINALLVLSVIIAVLGVVNTLVLAVIERTRELGLLRAVGMTRRQLKRMVRLESVLISTYGASLGLVLGAVLGVALVQALEGQGVTELVVPGGRLLLFLVIGAVIGVVAAAWPARRAARLEVLQAIATV